MFLGIIYHKDTETDSCNYIGLTYGETKEETQEKLSKIKTPKYRENILILEYGKDVSDKLHEDLKNENLDYYYSDSHFWCDDELSSILKLNFKKTEYKSYSV